MHTPAERHAFDEAVALSPTVANQFSGRTDARYRNFIGPFGGVTAATLLNAVLQHPDRLGEPLALTVNYAAAIADGPFTVDARAVRTNRSTQHWSIELAQEDGIVVTATAVFATRRATWSATEARPPDAPPPETLRPLDVRNLPTWFKRYDLRFVRGNFLPGSEEQTDSVSTLWMHDKPPRPLDFLSLTAFCDVFYPRVFVRRQKSSPVGTVSMTVYFHVDGDLLARQGAEPVLGTARGQRFLNGYLDQAAEVWSHDGELLATSHQIVYYRDAHGST